MIHSLCPGDDCIQRYFGVTYLDTGVSRPYHKFVKFTHHLSWEKGELA